MEDTQVTESKTIIRLLENISNKLDSISEYVEFKKKEELYKRELARYYPRGKLLLDEEDGFETRVRLSKEHKNN